ncbi:amidohydrolase [Candidatus Poribacteria bacterium]|nr:amidohydrolase [Candidatus Poribacteria bacterium]
MHTVTAASIADSARAIQDWIVTRRRFLHQNPELSFQEAKTSAYVERELKWLGFTRIHTGLNGNHGICAELLGRDRSHCIALRADMDALPIQEETEWEFKSRAPSVSHMCGHDAHTAMLLGAARILKEREADLPCTVRFFFQGGEERFPGGARDFITAGMLDGVDSVYGLHVDPRFDTGTIHFVEGNALAGIEEFTITIRGKGGHAAYPQATDDPVLAAAHVVTALQQVVSRRTDPFEPAVVSVTQFHAGSAFNVIPSEAVLNGTVRSFRPDMHAHFGRLIRQVVENAAAGFGCTAHIDQPEGYPPLYNHPDALARMARAAEEILGEGVCEGAPLMGSEDFSLYTRERPACFAFLGVAAPADSERYMLHHPKFHIDEDALWRGSATLSTVAMNGV